MNFRKGLPALAAREDTIRLLATEEQGVERNGFGQGHADDGLDEDFSGCAGVAADTFDGFGSDQTDANGGGQTAEGSLNAPGDFSDVDHDV